MVKTTGYRYMLELKKHGIVSYNGKNFVHVAKLP